MRNLIFLTLLVFTVPLFAQESNNLVQPLGSAPQIVIPAAGATPGANGTFFRSDINLINYANREQRVRLRWLPEGTSGASIPVREVTLSPLSGIQSEDFVTTVMQQTGLGAILISAVDAEGALDATARLYATSRIWTPQPGTAGTTSQTFPTVPTSILSGARLSLIGLKRDDRYRLNVGVVNLDATNTQTYRVILAGTNPTLAPEIVTVTVPPLSMEQIPLNGPSHASVQLAVTNESAPVNSPLWLAYGSSVDNVTGDSWSMIGFTAPQ